MNDADETDDCMRSVRDFCASWFNSRPVFGGSFGSAESILEPADDFIVRLYLLTFATSRDDAPREMLGKTR
jgi:hypothetical protein